MNSHALEAVHLTLDQFSDINTTTKSVPFTYSLFIVIFQQDKSKGFFL